MPTDSFPSSPEAVEAATQLLGRVPKTWAAVPELTHLESQGLGLLVAGGLVERRLSMLLRAVGDGRAVAIRFRFTGQAGLAQAVEPALAEAWALWEAAWKAGRKVYAEPSEGEGEWRLTDQGELAEKCRVGGLDDVRYLRDFLRTPGVPGVGALPPPWRFVPGAARFAVNGEGHAERVEVVNAGSEPLSVRVENLEEVSVPLGDIARAVQEGLERLAAAGASPGGKDRPPRLWTHSHCPNCGADGIEFLSHAEFSRRARKGRHSRLDRKTVGRRIEEGRYCADAQGNVPWCSRCRDKTPEGPGVERPVDALHIDDYQLTDEDKENVTAWAQAITRKRCPDFDVGLLNPDAATTQRGAELFQVAATAIMEALKSRLGKLTRDEAEQSAEDAIKRHVDEETSSLKRSRAHLDLSNRPPDE